MQIPKLTRGVAEKVYIVVENNQGAEVPPGTIMEWTHTATVADQGRLVETVDVAVNLTTGLAAKIAGVVDSTIATSDTGRLQVYGPCEVASTTTLAVGTFAVATSAGIAPTGVVTTGSASTLCGPAYSLALMGFVMEDTSATKSAIQLNLL